MVEPTAALAAATAEYREAEEALERVASGAQAGTSSAAAEDAAVSKPKAKAGKRKSGGDAMAAAAETVDDRRAAAGLAAQSWWLEAVDMLVVHSADGGAAASRHIKAQLGDLDSCALSVHHQQPCPGKEPSPFNAWADRTSRAIAAAKQYPSH